MDHSSSPALGNGRTRTARRLARSKVENWTAPLAIFLALSALAASLGGVLPFGLIAATIIAGCGVAWLVFRGPESLGKSLFPLAFLALAGVCLVQLVPLPLFLVALVSPKSAEVWRETLDLVNPSARFAPLSLSPPATVRALLELSFYGLLAILAESSARVSGRSRVLAIVFGLAFVASLSHPIHRALGQELLLGFYRPESPRPGNELSLLLNPNNAGAFYLLGGFSGLALRPRSPYVVATTFVVSIWLFLAIFLTGSRGASAAGLIGLALYGYFRGAKHLRAGARSKVLYPVLLIPSLATVAWFSLPETLQRTLLDRDTEKLALIRDSIRISLDYPLVGVGRGAFGTISAGYHSIPDNVYNTHPENLVLQWTTEIGIPVSVVLLGGLAWCISRGFEPRENSTDAAISAGLFSLLFQTMFDLSSEIPLIAGSFVAIVATGRRTVRRSSSPTFIAGALLVCTLVGGLLWTLRAAGTNLATTRQELSERVRKEPRKTTLEDDLDKAHLRYPGDFYLARLHSIASAHAGRSDAGKWLNRSLLAGPRSGRTHLWAAAWIGLRNPTQAMLEIRKAVEFDNTLPGDAANLAIELSHDTEHLLRSAPGGEGGVVYLREIYARTSNLEERAKFAVAIAEHGNTDPMNRVSAISALLAAGTRETAKVARKQLEILRGYRTQTFARYGEALILESDGRIAESHAVLAKLCSMERGLEPSCVADLVRVASRLPSLDTLEKEDRTVIKDHCGTTIQCAATWRHVVAIFRSERPSTALEWSREVALLTQEPADYESLATLAESLGRFEVALEARESLLRLRGSPTDEAELLRVRGLATTRPEK